MPSLAEQLASLADPKPVDFDPEDIERQKSDEEAEIDAKATEHYVVVG
jgi:hypothetical protein